MVNPDELYDGYFLENQPIRKFYDTITITGRRLLRFSLWQMTSNGVQMLGQRVLYYTSWFYSDCMNINKIFDESIFMINLFLYYVNIGNFSCPPGFLKCSNSYCIPPKLMCNGVLDCQHGEDEQDCGKINLILIKSFLLFAHLYLKLSKSYTIVDMFIINIFNKLIMNIII